MSAENNLPQFDQDDLNSFSGILKISQRGLKTLEKKDAEESAFLLNLKLYMMQMNIEWPTEFNEDNLPQYVKDFKMVALTENGFKVTIEKQHD